MISVLPNGGSVFHADDIIAEEVALDDISATEWRSTFCVLIISPSFVALDDISATEWR